MPALYSNRIIVGGLNATTYAPVVMWSEDAVTWNEVVGFPGASAASVRVTGDSYFIGTAAEFTANNYAYSGDAENWTLGSMGRVVGAMAWTGNYYVNLSTNAATRATSRTGPVWTSAITGSGSGNNGRRLLYRSGRLVGAIAATDTQPSIVVSDDEGATWTAVDATPGLGFGATEPTILFDMDYGAGRYVAVCARGGSGDLDRWIITSTNGLTWTSHRTGLPDHFPIVLRYGNGKFVAIGTGPSPLFQVTTYTSPDGLNWTMHTPTGLPGGGVFSNSEMAFWRGKFVWVNPLSGTIYTSTNGIAWTGTVFANRDWRTVDAGQARPLAGIYRDGRIHLS